MPHLLLYFFSRCGHRMYYFLKLLFFSSRRRHTMSYGDWSSDVCSSDLVKRAREKDVENVFSCVIWTGLRWTPGKPYCSLVLLTDPALRAQHGVEAEQLELMLGRLRKALNHFVGKAGSDYSVVANTHDATEVSASVLLEHYDLA